jgi:hypothetical protein
MSKQQWMGNGQVARSFFKDIFFSVKQNVHESGALENYPLLTQFGR